MTDGKIHDGLTLLDRLIGRNVPRETMEKLEAYEAMVRGEAARKNLVAASTLDEFWSRHILDSAQLVRFNPRPSSSWLDIGSGAGLPGIVVACLTGAAVTLVEPRRLRADFLHRVAESLQLRVTVEPNKVERSRGSYDVITARAVASLSELLRISHHLSTTNTVWILPKGRGGKLELAEVQQSWQGMFHVEQSATDAESQIIVGTRVRRRDDTHRSC